MFAFVQFFLKLFFRQFYKCGPQNMVKTDRHTQTSRQKKNSDVQIWIDKKTLNYKCSNIMASFWKCFKLRILTIIYLYLIIFIKFDFEKNKHSSHPRQKQTNNNNILIPKTAVINKIIQIEYNKISGNLRWLILVRHQMSYLCKHAFEVC